MSETKEPYLTKNPVQIAETITQMLQDEVPGINWLVEYDSAVVSGVMSGFRIRGTLMVGSVPHNAMLVLSVEEYESGEWLERVTHILVHNIAHLILRKNRPA